MKVVKTNYDIYDTMYRMLYYSKEGPVKKFQGNPWQNIFNMLEKENYSPSSIHATLNNFFIKYPKWIPSYIKYITVEGIKINEKIRNELDKIYNNVEKRSINEMKQQMIYTMKIVVENVIKSNFTEEYDEFFTKPRLKNNICREILKELGYNFIGAKKKNKSRIR